LLGSTREACGEELGVRVGSTQTDIRGGGVPVVAFTPTKDQPTIDLRDREPAGPAVAASASVAASSPRAARPDAVPVWIPKHRLSKRLMDVVLSVALLILLAPVLAVAAIAIKLDDGGPILYRQRRVGYKGRPFQIIKFRSMTVGAERLRDRLLHRNVTDGLLFKLQDDPRVTRVGRVLRRLSIDELPQLWNVLRGEMSLVGPRPLLADPSDFAGEEARRHDVLPGITGIWQVSGCNDLSYREMITLDLAYIASWSMIFDLILLARTVPALVRRRGPA
jgi:lipopolysaccharide/colanic/teichoic acid biosynthesis glycosyltransferase